MNTDSDATPLDGADQLDEDERLFVRRQKRDAERMRWLWRKLRWGVPIGAGIAGAVWQATEFVVKHLRIVP